MTDKENPRRIRRYFFRKALGLAGIAVVTSSLTGCDRIPFLPAPQPAKPSPSAGPSLTDGTLKSVPTVRPTEVICPPTSTAGPSAQPSETAPASSPTPRATETRTPSPTSTEVTFTPRVIIPSPAEGQREGTPLSVKLEVREDIPGASAELRENVKSTIEEYVVVMTVTTMDIISWLQKQQSVNLTDDQRLQLNQQRLQIEQQIIALKSNTTQMLSGESGPTPITTVVPSRQRPDLVRPNEAVLFFPSRRPGLPFTTVFEIDENQPSGTLKEAVKSNLGIYSNLTSEMTADLMSKMQAQKGRLTDQQKAQFEAQLLGFRQTVSQILQSGPIQ